jgi:serine/threonine-protein kinase
LKRAGRLGLQEASTLLSQTAIALELAHAAGIVHRDLKPANLFIAWSDGEEVVKVLDFGVAKLDHIGAATETRAEETATGAMLGSPAYMSPEQVRHARLVDSRSDLWSLGVIVYRAITGQKPFEGESVGDTIAKIVSEPLPPPSTVAPDLGPEIDEYFARALARDPATRFQTAREMAVAFAALAFGRPAADGVAGRFGPPPPSLPRPTSVAGSTLSVASNAVEATAHKKQPSMTVAVLAGTGIGVFVLALMIGSFYVLRRGEPRPARTADAAASAALEASARAPASAPAASTAAPPAATAAAVASAAPPPETAASSAPAASGRRGGTRPTTAPAPRPPPKKTKWFDE